MIKMLELLIYFNSYFGRKKQAKGCDSLTCLDLKVIKLLPKRKILKLLVYNDYCYKDLTERTCFLENIKYTSTSINICAKNSDKNYRISRNNN
jgi:hypothetical protein